jgi:hypothetical protein
VTKVFVVRDGKAHTVPVRTGVTVEAGGPDHARNWVEVEGELPEPAAVVTSGHGRLADGSAVRLREEGKGQ